MIKYIKNNPIRIFVLIIFSIIILGILLYIFIPHTHDKNIKTTPQTKLIITIDKNYIKNDINDYLSKTNWYYNNNKNKITFSIASIKKTNTWNVVLLPSLTKDGEPTITLNLDWTTSVNNGDINSKLEKL